MTEPTVLRLDQLRAAAEQLLDQVASLRGDRVEVDADYFWSIPPDALYEVTEQPAELTIGRLTECAEHIDQLLTDGRDPLAYHLVWLGELLRAVGHTVVG